MKTSLLVLLKFICVSARRYNFEHHKDPAIPGEAFIQNNSQYQRFRRQENKIPGGVDFSGCVTDPDTGLCCVDKEETVTSLEKEPILECSQKNTEQCHYTYVTQFKPSQEEVCEENFEKQCSITFKQQAYNETVNKCYRPVEKVCNGQGEEVCQTVYESSCTTKYVEKQPGKFVGDTACEKLPVEICGAGCVFEEGEEECQEDVVATVVDLPEEICDLIPHKVCKYETKLIPKLSPVQECTIVPKQTCQIRFQVPKQVEKPLKTIWCLDNEGEDNYLETDDVPQYNNF